MKITTFFLSFCAIAAIRAGPIKKSVITAPGTTKALTIPATLPMTNTTPVIAPAQLVASKYRVSFKLADVEYTDEFSIFNTAPFQEYAGKIENALMNLYADDNAYREMKVLGFRNETGVVAAVSLRFANESTNLVSLDSLVNTGNLNGLPVDPTSLAAEKDEPNPQMAMNPCPSCISAPMISTQSYGAAMTAGQCSSQCSSSCAPSCPLSCCNGASINPGIRPNTNPLTRVSS